MAKKNQKEFEAPDLSETDLELIESNWDGMGEKCASIPAAPNSNEPPQIEANHDKRNTGPTEEDRPDQTWPHRERFQQRCNFAIGIEKRARTGTVPSDHEIADLIVGWCDACRHLETELDDCDAELVSRLFVASQDAVIELAVTLDMDADRLLKDRTGESVMWRQMRARANRIRGRLDRIADEEKPRLPSDPEIHQLCRLLNAYNELPDAPGVTALIRAYLEQEYGSVETQAVESLRRGVYRYAHLWRS